VLTKVENVVKVEPVGEFELKGIRWLLAVYMWLLPTLLTNVDKIDVASRQALSRRLRCDERCLILGKDRTSLE